MRLSTANEAKAGLRKWTEKTAFEMKPGNQP